MGDIVVGVDGSKNARAAMDFAVEEARLRGAKLRAVYVQDGGRQRGGPRLDGLDVGYTSAEGYQALVERSDEEREEMQTRARQHAEQLLEQVVRSVESQGDVEIERVTLFDRRPARRLVELVNGDPDNVALLVIGARGRGELTSVLLGSVSQACVTHARVPVTVVPARDR